MFQLTRVAAIRDLGVVTELQLHISQVGYPLLWDCSAEFRLTQISLVVVPKNVLGPNLRSFHFLR